MIWRAKSKIMKILFIVPWKPLGVSDKSYLLSSLCLHIGLPSHPAVTADSNTLRELCQFLYKILKRGTLNRFNVPHLPYWFIMAILSKILSLSLSDWCQLQLTYHQSFYNYQANCDYLTLFLPIVINKTGVFPFRPFYNSNCFKPLS